MAGQLTLKNLVGFGMAYVFVFGVGIIDIVLFGDWLTPWILFVAIIGFIGVILQYEIYVRERFELDTYVRGYSTMFVLFSLLELIGHLILDLQEVTNVDGMIAPYLAILTFTIVLWWFDIQLDKTESQIKELESQNT